MQAHRPQRQLAYSPPPRQWQPVSAVSSRLPSPVPPQRWTYVSPRRSAPSMPSNADPACRARGRHSSFEPRRHAPPGLCARQSVAGSMLCPSPGSAWSGSMLVPAPPPSLGHVLGTCGGSAAYPPAPQLVRAVEPIVQPRGRSPVPAARLVMPHQSPHACAPSPPRQVAYTVRSPSPGQCHSQAAVTPRGPRVTSPPLAQSCSYALPVLGLWTSLLFCMSNFRSNHTELRPVQEAQRRAYFKACRLSAFVCTVFPFI